jgi:predicted bacteriocin transport accessory protein
MMKKWTLSFLALLLLCGCSQAQTEKEAENTEQTVDEACDSDVYGCEAEVKSEDESTFEQISFDDAIALFENKGSGILYFGFPDCPWCQEVVPELASLAKEDNVNILYVRTRDDDRERLYTDEQKEQIQPYMENYMSENDEGVMTLYVPVVAVVKDGEVIAGHVGSIEGHNAKEEELTEEQKEELKEILQSLLDTAKEAGIE